MAAEDGGQVESSPGEKEYREKSQKLLALETKVSELESHFKTLVKAKEVTTSKDKKLALIEEMKTVQQERDDAAEKFNKLRDEVRFKFPDKGKTVMRRFAPMQKKTVKQLEKRSTLDADLTSAKKAAEKAYRPFIRKAEEEERKRLLEQKEAKKSSKSASEDSKVKIPKIRLEK